MSGTLDRMRSWWGGRETHPQDGGERWVVVDVETSGLDAHQDRLLAIAALGLQTDPVRRRIDIVPGDSFEVVLRQDAVSDHDNILLHGIGAQRQRDGVEPARALQAFADFVGPSPLLAFHSAFDQTLQYNRRALKPLGLQEIAELDHGARLVRIARASPEP